MSKLGQASLFVFLDRRGRISTRPPGNGGTLCTVTGMATLDVQVATVSAMPQYIMIYQLVVCFSCFFPTPEIW